MFFAARLFLIATIPYSSYEYERQIQKERAEANCEAENYELLLQDMQKQICNYESDIYTLESLNSKLLKQIPKRRYRALSVNFSSNVTLKSTLVDDRICSSLKQALREWTGPDIIWTSGLRDWPSSSDHVEGRAVDWSWDPAVVDFLDSPEGQDWLNRHEIDFRIENVPRGKYREHKKYRYIPWATGPHIHLYKTCKKKTSI